MIWLEVFVLAQLFEIFVREKHFLKNVTNKTISFYNSAFIVFKKAFPELPETITKPHLNQFVIYMREAGLSPISCNTHISAINSFLSWLFENEYTPNHLKIKKLQTEHKIIQAWNEAQLKRILAYKPKSFPQYRMYAFICTLIDTGIRFEEALSLKTNDVDFDNLVIKILGKGNKHRLVPMSVELRKILYKYKQKNRFDIFFPSSKGEKLIQRNIYRDMKLLAAKLGITGVRVSPHTFRHTFALQYLKGGGDLFTLSRILGHTNIATTQIYLRSMGIEQIKEAHTKISLLNRLH